MSIIHIEDLSKHFKILNRREGLSGAFRDLISGDNRTVEAVSGISFDIDAGEIVDYIIPMGFFAFYPSQLFLRPQDVSTLIYFSPIVGIGLFALTYWIWTKGVNSYTGTGA